MKEFKKGKSELKIHEIHKKYLENIIANHSNYRTQDIQAISLANEKIENRVRMKEELL